VTLELALINPLVSYVGSSQLPKEIFWSEGAVTKAIQRRRRPCGSQVHQRLRGARRRQIVVHTLLVGVHTGVQAFSANGIDRGALLDAVIAEKDAEPTSLGVFS